VRPLLLLLLRLLPLQVRLLLQAQLPSQVRRLLTQVPQPWLALAPVLQPSLAPLLPSLACQPSC
jgi:hypothetical protein